MNKIMISEMDDKIGKVYSYISDNILGWDITVKNTIWRGTPSKNSYCFDIQKSNNEAEKLLVIKNALIDLFVEDSTEYGLFERAINQVCSGSGNEAEKITVLRSSSLCGLLNFYNVPKNPITIEVEEDKKIQFTKVFFEVKNKVLANPSNIDLVLISEDNSNVLFLESKFAEYYLDNGLLHISQSYLTNNDISKQFYSDEILKGFGFNIQKDKNDNIVITTDEDGNITFAIDSKKSELTKAKSYVGGIKQMVSHYIGIDNFLKEDVRSIKRFDEEICLSADVNIYLGEVLFDFPSNTDMYKYFEDYQEKYDKLVSVLNYNENIKLLPKILKYSDYKSRLNDRIRKYYFGNE